MVVTLATSKTLVVVVSRRQPKSLPFALNRFKSLNMRQCGGACEGVKTAKVALWLQST